MSSFVCLFVCLRVASWLGPVGLALLCPVKNIVCLLFRRPGLPH
jgi:hypothetical protein